MEQSDGKKQHELEMSELKNKDDEKATLKANQSPNANLESVKIRVKNNSQNDESHLEEADEKEQFKPPKEDEILGPMILDVDKALLVNEKDFDGLTNDNIQDPEVIKALEEEVELMHPTTKTEDGAVQKYPVCKTNVGIIGCCESQSKSELEPLGLGMVFYFKLVKCFTIIFFVISVINIPLYYVYFNSHSEYKASGYQDYLFKTTIGNIGSSKIYKNLL